MIVLIGGHIPRHRVWAETQFLMVLELGPGKGPKNVAVEGAGNLKMVVQLGCRGGAEA